MVDASDAGSPHTVDPWQPICIAGITRSQPVVPGTSTEPDFFRNSFDSERYLSSLGIQLVDLILNNKKLCGWKCPQLVLTEQHYCMVTLFNPETADCCRILGVAVCRLEVYAVRKEFLVDLIGCFSEKCAALCQMLLLTIR